MAAALATRVLPVDPAWPDPADLREAAALLDAGELVAFPTETVYGLGADGLNADAVARIYAAKGRPSTNPLILHVDGLPMARGLVRTWPAAAIRLAEAFWPGPLTLVLPRRAGVPDAVTGGGDTVALRMPAHRVPLSLIGRLGRPLAAPSANLSERISPTLAAHVLEDLEGRIPLVLDGGPTRRGLESTVVDLSGERPRILRPGPIPPRLLERLLGSVATLHAAPGAGPAPSPGLGLRHYAPRLPLHLRAEGEPLPVPGPAAWLALDAAAEPPPPGITRVAMPRDPEAYGARLYATLRSLDRPPFLRIVVDLPPAAEAWAAVHDRLRRAAARPACA
ncbi:MAG: L-threonylcarbamoyladenylate synthase [Holophagaceae bacterium]